MTDVLIQFHAAPDELVEFARAVTAEFSVHVTALRFFPFSATLVGADLIAAAAGDPTVRELAFTIDPPSLPAINATEFLDRNPSALHLELGRPSEEGLAESCLSARITDEVAIAMWRRVARELRKVTQAGAVAINPATGAMSRMRSHRFTAGAKALDESGVVIRPVAGSALLRLGTSNVAALSTNATMGASASSRSATEVLGVEYDWLGRDPNGYVALFSTAGAGYAPAEFLRDVDAHDIAIQGVLALPPTTEARFFPAVAPGLVNTWRLVAERGLYAYDCDPNGGPYRLVAAPVVAAEADALPPEVVGVAARIRCRARFELQTVVTEEMLR